MCSPLDHGPETAEAEAVFYSQQVRAARETVPLRVSDILRVREQPMELRDLARNYRIFRIRVNGA